jgi:hypothetical protein
MKCGGASMNLITAIILSLWLTGWMLAAAWELLKARAVKVNHSITASED